MRDLRLRFTETDFARLTELGRSLVPSVAPGWTDHNVHDPGIMLVELLAWVADLQIYSLTRLRRDERKAYARLLGVLPRGPQPARGLIWPQGGDTAPWPPGAIVRTGTPVTGDRPDVPPFRTTHAVALTVARLVSVESRPGDGSPPRDLTAVNAHDGATFLPFGAPPAARDRLALKFRGRLFDETSIPASLSIGVEIVRPDSPAEASASAEDGGARQRVPLAVFVVDSAGERALELVEDTTLGLLRSGALLLRAGAGTLPIDDDCVVSIRAPGGLLRSPKVRRIDVNVLPTVQQESVTEEEARFGTGQPDQEFRLRREGPAPRLDENVVTVRIAGHAGFEDWRRVEDLKASGPADPVFVLDLADRVVRFGNGLNGRVPPLDAALQVDYEASAGARGNVPKDRRWSVRGIAGEIWTNAEPTAGGSDALDLAALRALARRNSRQSRPVVTRADLESAARTLPDLDVRRALEVPSGAAGRRVRGTRVLVAAGSSEAIPDSPAWRAEVRARLAPRLPLGQRLDVRGPDYVEVRVKAKLVATRLADPATVAQGAEAELRARFRTVAPRPGDEEWPFGRDVTPLAVRAWLRRVEGVASVTALSLLAFGQEAETIRLGASGLPRLQIKPGDIEVQPAGDAR